ncbi:MAG: hypothetical protein QG599_2550 [Pseudomonadota bacterium]|nr:hypothetical protein [Pseudomonadota bacterium]
MQEICGINLNFRGMIWNGEELHIQLFWKRCNIPVFRATKIKNPFEF